MSNQIKAPTSFLGSALASCKQAFLYVTLFSCVVNILTLTVSLYMFQLFDRVLLAGRSYDTLIYLTIIAIFALTILSILDAVRTRIMVFVSHWLDNKLSPEALERSVDNLLQGQSYAPQSLRDIAQVRGFVASAGMLAIMDTPWVPIYLIVIFLLNPLLGVIGTFGALIIFLHAVANEVMTRNILSTANTAAIKSQNQINATLRNAETIQAMGMLPSIIQRWYLDNQKVLDLQSLASQRGGLILASSKFFRYAVQVLILGVGAYLVVDNQLTAGGMVAASIILSRALAPIEQSISVWQQLTSARLAYKRLEEYFQKPATHRGEISLPAPKGYLVVENASLVPPGSVKLILRNISFSLNPGEILAIIGPSAAGKSCLARLLVGAWAPNAGNVRLDGVEVYTWNREEFGQYIGYLPQNIELFAGTIKENIARMASTKGIDDEAVIKAAQWAGAHDMILHLPEGYDTHLGETSYKLSGGQNQRVALARALFGHPQVLVLDEPNSNLDSDGEMALVNALKQAKEKGLTVVFIAHRPSLVDIADKILLLQEGVVQLFGSKTEVLTKLHEQQVLQAKSAANKGTDA